jgi:hypothetical protein
MKELAVMVSDADDEEFIDDNVAADNGSTTVASKS